MGYLTLFILALGFALFATTLFLYGVWKIVRALSLGERIRDLLRALGLSREETNPILEARPEAWEQGGVMNPAVVKAGGATHMFYRAVGADGVSRIGYAKSNDGVHMDERLPYPVFALATNAGGPEAFVGQEALGASGGSYAFAGVEDPRAVVIGNRVYLTFNAFSHWGSLRAAVTSLSLEDLMKRRWKWAPPVYLSPEGQVHKSWVLFPEKVAGKFSILHGFDADRRRANIHALDTLDVDPSPHLESTAGHRWNQDGRVWDSFIRGAGPPPVKTNKGWLVLYHANDAREPHRYKLGAMLLDLLNPTKVLARSPVPVLEPDAWYENNGKPGVVYACGATVEGDALRVYYGGGDQVVCTAVTSLKKLLAKLVPTDVVPHYSPAYATA